MNPTRRSTGTRSRHLPFRLIARGAFTLVEILVSVAILALILSIVGVMIGAISRTIGDTRKMLNSDDQARLVFARMDNDFSRMIKRRDIDIIFARQTTGSTSTGANDSIYFVTEASGSNSNTGWFSNTSANTLTLAGYCIAPDAQGIQVNTIVNSPLLDLNRLGHALTWDTAASSPDNLVFVSFAAPTAGSSASALIPSTTLDGHWGSTTIGSSPTYTPPTGGSNYSDYHAIADQVFRLEYCFLLKDGTYSNFPVLTSNGLRYNLAGTGPPAPANDNSDASTGTAGSVSTAYGAGSRWYDATHGRAFICSDATKGNATWAPLGVQDVSAIIVAIALLDRDSRTRITSASVMNNLPTFFADSLQAATTLGTTLTPQPISSGTNKSPILMQQNWQATVDSSAFASTSGLTADAAGHIRIYQRYFYLNANNL
jgi:prepilin-type N-terminal cleavage/methylation domain-containing protein